MRGEGGKFSQYFANNHIEQISVYLLKLNLLNVHQTCFVTIVDNTSVLGTIKKNLVSQFFLKKMGR